MDKLQEKTKWAEIATTAVLCVIMLILPSMIWKVPIMLILLAASRIWAGTPFGNKSSLHFANLFPFLLPLSFFALQLVGLLYSTNLQEGGAVIERQVAFVLVPLIIFTFPIRPQIKLKQILMFFVVGVFVSMLCCWVMAVINSFQTGHFNPHPAHNVYTSYFRHADFSLFHHPSHYSIYLAWAFCICIVYFNELFPLKQKINKLLNSIIIGLILCTILALDARVGPILLLVFSLVLIWKKPSQLNLKHKVIISLVGPLLILVAVTVFSKRLDTLVADNSPYSDQIHRLSIWKQGLNVFKEHPVWGVGTGDFKIHMQEAYWKERMGSAYVKELNAHNSYLQTAISHGLIGLAVLLLLIGSMLVSGFKRRNPLLLCFAMGISIAACFESIFNTFPLIAFFCLFYCILIKPEFNDQQV